MGSIGESKHVPVRAFLRVLRGGSTVPLMVAGMLVASAGPVSGESLYSGLPGGSTIAYVRSAGAWTRATGADLADVGYHARPALADLDADGDHDALVGESGGNVRAFQNTGSDAVPVWVRQPSWDPGLDVGDSASPAVADLDGDGDLDLLVGSDAGDLRGIENIGSPGAPAWRERSAWTLTGIGTETRPALGDLDGDRRPDLLVGTSAGTTLAFVASAAGFARAPAWDPPARGDRVVAPSLVDLDGDRRADLFLTDAYARTSTFHNEGTWWGADPSWDPPDPGSGPASVVVLAGRTSQPAPTTGPSSVPTAAPSSVPSPRPTATPVAGNHAPVARLAGAPLDGAPPLTVRLDASASVDADGDPLSFAWDFGDGSGAGGVPADPGAAIAAAPDAYTQAKATRDAGDYAGAVALYLEEVEVLMWLTTVTTAGPLEVLGTTRIDRVARYYLQKIGHDLGGIYLWHALGLATCDRFALSLQYSRESAVQAVAGGFPQQPSLNGTNENIASAEQSLRDAGCAIPAPAPVFAAVAGEATIEHRYTSAGRYVARVLVRDGAATASASVMVEVGVHGPPPSGGGDGAADPLEGFGATTRGGEGGRVIHVREATETAVRAALTAAKAGPAVVVFEVTGPIAVKKSLRVEGSFITIEGNGVALDGRGVGTTSALFEVRGHDVIVRDIRLRNGGDNLRAQGDGAYNVVFSHVSSTGAADDGVSIGYGAHDVTLQYSFLAGNTRSIFVKYGATTNVSIHHTWVMKQWIRGPLISGSVRADVRNLIVEDWTQWGSRFESASSGNLVDSLFVLGPYARSIGGKTNGALRLIQDGPVFTAGNVYDGLALDGAEGTARGPLDAPPVTTWPVGDMTDLVRARAGCLPRDAVDQAYIDLTTGWRVGLSPLRLTAP